MDTLRNRTQEELDEVYQKVRKLDETTQQLKDTRKLMKDYQTEAKHLKSSLEERDKEIEILKLTAENAQDGLENMRKEFNDNIEKELESQKEHFQKTESDLKNAKKNIRDLKEQLDNKDKQIKAKVEQSQKDKKTLNDANREIDFLHKRINYMEEQEDKRKEYEAQRVLEIDQLYKHNETIQSKLFFIQQNYDLDTLDEKMKSAKRTEEWAEQFMQDLKVFFNVFEAFMHCEICNLPLKKEQLMPPPLMVLPCMHFFCAECHRSKRKRIGRCSQCGVDEEKVLKNVFLVQFVESYHKFKAPLQKKMDQMRLRIDKGFAI